MAGERDAKVNANSDVYSRRRSDSLKRSKTAPHRLDWIWPGEEGHAQANPGTR